jgi:hypothetical protein
MKAAVLVVVTEGKEHSSTVTTLNYQPPDVAVTVGELLGLGQDVRTQRRLALATQTTSIRAKP